MPPKQPKSSRASKAIKPTSTLVRGRLTSGFRHDEEEKWYNHFFKSRVVLVERPLDVSNCIPTPSFLFPVLARPGWSTALGHVRTANASMVREFYASLMCIDADTYSYEAYVRGKKIPVNPASIGAIMGIPPLGEFECPYSGNNVPSGRMVCHEITNAKVQVFPAKRLDANLLTPEYRLLHLLIANVILPTTYKAGVDIDQARILFAIGSNKTVSLPHLLLVAIKSLAWLSSQNFGLKCGGLITAICLKAGVKAKSTDECIRQAGPFGEKSITRSQGQFKGLNKRKKVAEPEVQTQEGGNNSEEEDDMDYDANVVESDEEDDEEEGDGEGPSNRDEPYDYSYMQTMMNQILHNQVEYSHAQNAFFQNQEQFNLAQEQYNRSQQQDLQDIIRAQNETAMEIAALNAKFERMEARRGNGRNNRRNSD